MAQNMIMTTLSEEDLEGIFSKTIENMIPKYANLFNKKEDKKNNDEIFYTKTESADFLGCSNSTVDRYAREGLLKRYKISRAVRFKKSDLIALIENRKER